MKQITLPSGSILELDSAPFQEACRLRRIVAAELKAVSLSGLDSDADISLKALASLSGPTLEVLKGTVCQVLASEALESAVFSCAAKSLLNGQRITRDTFEPENMRQDYLPVAWEVVKHTLAPFFASLDLRSFLAKAPTGPTQKSE